MGTYLGTRFFLLFFDLTKNFDHLITQKKSITTNNVTIMNCVAHLHTHLDLKMEI